MEGKNENLTNKGPSGSSEAPKLTPTPTIELPVLSGALVDPSVKFTEDFIFQDKVSTFIVEGKN